MGRDGGSGLERKLRVGQGHKGQNGKGPSLLVGRDLGSKDVYTQGRELRDIGTCTSVEVGC